MAPSPAKRPPLTRSESLVLAKHRRGRNRAMLVALGVVAVLIYAIAIVQLGASFSIQLGLHS